MNIAHATIEGDKPVAIFEVENELKMKCIWTDENATDEQKIWSMNRTYRITPDGEYNKIGLKKREATEAEMLGIKFKNELEAKE